MLKINKFCNNYLLLIVAFFLFISTIIFTYPPLNFMYIFVAIVFLIVCVVTDISCSLSIVLAFSSYKSYSLDFNKESFILYNILFLIFVAIFGTKLICKMIKNKKLKNKSLYIVAFLILVFTIIRVGNVNSEHLKIAIKLFVFIIIVTSKDEINLDSIAKSYILGVILNFILSMLFSYNDSIQSYLIMYDSRFAGFSSNPNVLSMCCSTSLLCLLFLNSKKNFNNLSLFSVSLIVIIIGLLTYSKTFLVSVVVFLLFMLYKLIGKFYKYRYPIFVLIFSAVFLCCSVFRTYLDKIIQRFTNRNGLYNNLFDVLFTGRGAIWKDYLKIWLSTPVNILFGCGIDFEIYNKYCHSTFISIITRYGILGIMLLIVYTFLLFRCTRTRKKINSTQLIALIITTIMAMTESIVYLTNIHVLVILYILFFINETKIGDKDDTKNYSLHLVRGKTFAKNCRKMH